MVLQILILIRDMSLFFLTPFAARIIFWIWLMEMTILWLKEDNKDE